MAVEIFKLFGSIFVNNDEANKSIIFKLFKSCIPINFPESTHTTDNSIKSNSVCG